MQPNSLLKNSDARLNSRSRQRNVSLARLTCTIEQIIGHSFWISSASQGCSFDLLPETPFIRNLLMAIDVGTSDKGGLKSGSADRVINLS